MKVWHSLKQNSLYFDFIKRTHLKELTVGISSTSKSLKISVLVCAVTYLMVLIKLGLLFYKNILGIKIKIYKQSNNFNLHKKKYKWTRAHIILNFVNQDILILHCKFFFYSIFSQSSNLYDSMYQLNKILTKNQ